MGPEDKLDTLLSAMRQEADQTRSRGVIDEPLAEASMRESASYIELTPLMESAQRLTSLRANPPDMTFANALEARIRVRAAERLQQERLGLSEVGGKLRKTSSAWRPFILRRAMRLRLALIAAALLLSLGLGTLATAAAEPGDPLFGLHRLEQRVQTGMAHDSAASARQSLQFARQWLAALHNAAAQHLGDPTYSDALSALREDDANAALEISQLPQGAQRAALEAELRALRTDERATLRGALTSIGLPDRITTTQALGALGVVTPRLTGATLSAGSDGKWRVALSGEGIEPGALLLVSGQPVGAVTRTSAGTFTAELPVEDGAPASLAVGNPDGTAAATDNIQVLSSEVASPTPTEPDETPQPDEQLTPSPTTSSDGGQLNP